MDTFWIATFHDGASIKVKAENLVIDNSGRAQFWDDGNRKLVGLIDNYRSVLKDCATVEAAG